MTVREKRTEKNRRTKRKKYHVNKHTGRKEINRTKSGQTGSSKPQRHKQRKQKN